MRSLPDAIHIIHRGLILVGTSDYYPDFGRETETRIESLHICIQFYFVQETNLHK